MGGGNDTFHVEVEVEDSNDPLPVVPEARVTQCP